jgi:4-hydroxy-2-oxoglutarate aldolase
MFEEMLSGVFAPVVTPFDKEEVRYDWLAENLAKLGESGLTGYLALGSNGEFMSLTRDEQLAVLDVFAEYKDHKVVMAGTGRESTCETIEMSCLAARRGADFVSVLTPHYFARRVTDEVLLRHYTEVAENVPVPVMLYNAPGFAGGVQLSPAVVRELAEHPNIAGMKDSSPAGMSGYLAATRGNDSFHVLAGSANFFFTALVSGAAGGVLSLANCLPDECCALYSACREGGLDEARRLHFRLLALNKAVSGRAGVAAVKAAMDLMGYRGGAPRRPLMPLDDAGREAIRMDFEREGIL